MSNYKVGKGKPPLDTRFKPGQSGNPRGRPPKKEQEQNIIDQIFKHLQKKRLVNKNGKTVRTSLDEIGAENLAHGYAKNDPTAMKLILAMQKLRPSVIETPGECILIEFQPVRAYGSAQEYDAAMAEKKRIEREEKEKIVPDL